MLDLTDIDAISLDLGRVLDIDDAAQLLLLDGGGTTLATLTQDTPGWYVTDDTEEETLTVEFVENDTITRAILNRLASVVYYRNSTDPPTRYVRGRRVRWEQASSRKWTLRGYVPAGVY